MLDFSIDVASLRISVCYARAHVFGADTISLFEAFSGHRDDIGRTLLPHSP
jgi:hypothetical protein